MDQLQNFSWEIKTEVHTKPIIITTIIIIIIIIILMMITSLLEHLDIAVRSADQMSRI